MTASPRQREAGTRWRQRADTVLAYLAGHPEGTKAEDVGPRVGVSESYAKVLLADLVATGEVVRRRKFHRAPHALGPFLYYVRDDSPPCSASPSDGESGSCDC